MYHHRFDHQAGRQDSIKSSPVPGVDHVDMALAEEFSKPKNRPDIIAGTLVQYMMDDRTLEPLQELAAVRYKTQFMNEMIRRMIDDVDDAILQATMPEAVKHVEDSNASPHRLMRLPVKPETEHQNTPKLRRTIPESRLMLVPYLLNKGF
jgi:flagellar motor component MotA